MKLAIPDKVSPSYFPAIAAIELGYFRDEGLNVELELIFPPNKTNEAMRDGTIDLVAASAHATLSAFPNWEGVKLICAQSRGMYWFLVMHRDLGIARGDLSALKGRRIGAAPWVQYGLRGLLLAAGLDAERDGIEIAPVPRAEGIGANFGISAAQALQDKRIDGFWANGMAAEVAVRNGFGEVIVDARRDPQVAEGFGFTFPSVAASDRTIAAHPGLPAKVSRAIRRVHDTLKADLSVATRVAERVFPAEPAAMTAELIRRDLPFYDDVIRPEDIALMNRFAMSVGILDRDVPFADVVASR
jgi:NitT/TauT family transport system substrate-binding protein